MKMNIWHDGDPLDVIVLTTYPLHPGILVKVRPVAVMDTTDTGDSDAKVIAVPVDDKCWEEGVLVIPSSSDSKLVLWYYDSYMTFKTFLASVTIAATFLGPVFVFAQEITPPETAVVIAPVIIDPTTQMQNELTGLRTHENNPTTGFIARFFIRLKIRELENKLNIATALN